MTFKQFHRKAISGLRGFFSTHLPKAIEHSHRFFSAVNTGHKFLGHLNTEVGKSSLFNAEQKGNLAGFTAASGGHLKNLNEKHRQAVSFTKGVSGGFQKALG